MENLFSNIKNNPKPIVILTHSIFIQREITIQAINNKLDIEYFCFDNLDKIQSGNKLKDLSRIDADTFLNQSARYLALTNK